MVYTVVYFVVLLVMTIYSFKNRVSILGRILVVLYTAIAGLSVYSISTGMWSDYEISGLPYLLLLIAYSFFFQPFVSKNNRLSVDKVIKTIDDRYRLLLYIYIVCSIVYLINFTPYVLRLLSAGDWLNNYNSQVLGRSSTTFVYGNRLEWLATQIATYTQWIAIIVAFLYLREKRRMKLAILTIIIYTISSLCAAIYVSSRGMLYALAFTLFGLYLFVFPDIRNNVKRFVAVMGVALAVVAVSYVLNVTVSRFGTDTAGDSIIRYLSQPPIVFNDGIKRIRELSFGTYTIGALFGKYVNQSTVGGIWIAGFYTFVGWLYIDWGAIGVVVIGIVTSFIVTRIVRKRIYNVSDLLIVFYYYAFLIDGALVTGPQQIVSILMTLLLYVLVKFFIEKTSLKQHNNVHILTD